MIRFNDPRDGNAIARAASPLGGGRFHAGVDMCMARIKDGKLLGGVIYTKYTGRSITMQVAAFDRRWVFRDGLWLVFDYPFNQIMVDNLFAEVSTGNRTALHFNLHLGFTEVAKIPDVYPDGDMVILRMRKDECRWLKLKPLQRRSNELSRSAAAA